MLSRPARARQKPARPWLPVVWAGLLFAGALAVRLHGLGAKPLWMDEVTTLKRASLPLGPMLWDSLRFHQLPAFFAVTSCALRFGSDAFWLRLPAALFGALSCALAFAAGRSAGGLRAGLAAGLLMALSPAMVQYGQEARSYTMVISAILLALWGFLEIAQARSLRLAWTAFVLGTVLALNVLSVALFWWLAANLAGGVLCARRDGGFRRRWVAAQALILALSSPGYAAIALLGEQGTMGGLDWVPGLSRARLWWAFAGTYLLDVTSLIKVRVFPAGVPGLGLAVAALAAAGALTAQRAVRAGLLIATLCLPLALLLISLVTPVLMPRYLLWGAAPYFICAGLGVSRLPQAAQWPALAILALLLARNLAPYYHTETKPLWNLAARELAAGMRPGDLLLVDDPQAVSMMNLYLPPGQPIPDRAWTTRLGQARAWLRAGGRVWAVQGAVGQADHETQAAFLRRTAALGPPAARAQAGLDIIVLRFDGQPAPMPPSGGPA